MTNTPEVINFTRSNKKPEENFSYEFVMQKHRVDVTRSDGKKHTFCVGDEFITYANNKVVIESFLGGDDYGVYGVGTKESDGKDVSLANQLDKL